MDRLTAQLTTSFVAIPKFFSSLFFLCEQFIAFPKMQSVSLCRRLLMRLFYSEGSIQISVTSEPICICKELQRCIRCIQCVSVLILINMCWILFAFWEMGRVHMVFVICKLAKCVHIFKHGRNLTPSQIKVLCARDKCTFHHTKHSCAILLPFTICIDLQSFVHNFYGYCVQDNIKWGSSFTHRYFRYSNTMTINKTLQPHYVKWTNYS